MGLPPSEPGSMEAAVTDDVIDGSSGATSPKPETGSRLPTRTADSSPRPGCRRPRQQSHCCSTAHASVVRLTMTALPQHASRRNRVAHDSRDPPRRKAPHRFIQPRPLGSRGIAEARMVSEVFVAEERVTRESRDEPFRASLSAVATVNQLVRWARREQHREPQACPRRSNIDRGGVRTA